MRERVENFLGDDVGVAREYANYHNVGGKNQWDETTAPVGSLKPYGYGLHDMADNAWNGYQDRYDGDLQVYRALRERCLELQY